MLSTMIPDPLCLYMNLPSFGLYNRMNSYGFIILISYIIISCSLFLNNSEKEVSAPFKLINLLFPSVMYILILLILFLLTGLNVTLFGSIVNE